MSIHEAAQIGRLEGLIALRDRIALEMDSGAQARDVAALSRQFTDVLLQIDELSAGSADKPMTALDELRKRREARTKKTG